MLYIQERRTTEPRGCIGRTYARLNPFLHITQTNGFSCVSGLSISKILGYNKGFAYENGSDELSDPLDCMICHRDYN